MTSKFSLFILMNGVVWIISHVHMPVFFHYLKQIFAPSLTRICDVLTIYHESNPIYDWSSFKPISTNKSHLTLTWILILLLFCIYLLYMYVCWNLITLYICFRKNIKNVGKSQPLYLVKLRWYISVQILLSMCI